jgi:hypothetical protein
MSCHTQTYASVTGWPARSVQRDRCTRNIGRSDQPFVLWLVVALYESFHEALHMQRLAYKQHRLPEE